MLEVGNGDRAKILVTGANGMVGSFLVQFLESKRRYDLQVALRRDDHQGERVVHVVGNIDGTTDWTDALDGKDVVIHLAARTHIAREVSIDPISDYRRLNVEGTRNLAAQSVRAGVKRFIFMSTIKVNGNTTIKGRPFTESDVPSPSDPYGVSKLEAELALRELASSSGMEYVVLRPPLIYGPKLKGNLMLLSKLVSSRVPLPLASVSNQRTLLGVENLASLVELCVYHPAAANKIFLAGDSRDLSTSELVAMVSRAQQLKDLQFRCPASFLKIAARLLGKTELVQRLLESLQVDSSRARFELGWDPVVGVEEGLLECFRNKC